MKSPAIQEKTLTPLSGRLAIAFQEPLTAVVRIRQAQSRDFRNWFTRELDKSAEQARLDNYSDEDIDHARFALVAFVDEAARYMENAVLSDWTSVQGEVYHSEDAGETFFTRLKDIQRRGNTRETADLLEVYSFCLLLGFEGKYRLRRQMTDTRHESIPPLITDITKQIAKIRHGDILPEPWKIADAPSVSLRTDVWIRRLTVASICLVVCLGVLFGVYKASLTSGLTKTQSELRGHRGQGAL